MSDTHITRELLAALNGGWIDHRRLSVHLLEHLIEVCPCCRREAETFQLELRGLSHPFPTAFGAAARRLEDRLPAYDDALKGARRQLRELRRLSPVERVGRIHRARKRFATPELAHLLCQESRAFLPGDCAAAQGWAELAFLVSERTSAAGTAACKIRALGHLANARRAHGSLQEAAGMFRAIREDARDAELTDPLLIAELDNFEGSLRRDQRRFDQALKLLDRSAALYWGAGEVVDAGRSRIAMATVYMDSGDPEEGARVALEVLKILPAEELRLRLCAVHTWADCLCCAREYSKARKAITRYAGLYDQFPDPWTQLRRRWVVGKIAAGLGEILEAEEAFLNVREGFVALGHAFDVGLVTLDLATLYLHQGRTADVRRLTERMMTTFEACGVHREVIAAASLFQEAARAEAVTVAMVRSFGRYLEAMRRSPSLEMGAA